MTNGRLKGRPPDAGRVRAYGRRLGHDRLEAADRSGWERCSGVGGPLADDDVLQPGHRTNRADGIGGAGRGAHRCRVAVRVALAAEGGRAGRRRVGGLRIRPGRSGRCGPAAAGDGADLANGRGGVHGELAVCRRAPGRDARPAASCRRRRCLADLLAAEGGLRAGLVRPAGGGAGLRGGHLSPRAGPPAGGTALGGRRRGLGKDIVKVCIHADREGMTDVLRAEKGPNDNPEHRHRCENLMADLDPAGAGASEGGAD